MTIAVDLGRKATKQANKQKFGWNFYQELTVTMVQVPEGTAVSTQGQHYVRHADQRRSFKLSSGCLRFVNWTISSYLTLQASKLY